MGIETNSHTYVSYTPELIALLTLAEWHDSLPDDVIRRRVRDANTGDVVFQELPDDQSLPIRLDENAYVAFLIKDSQAGKAFSELNELFFKPAIGKIIGCMRNVIDAQRNAFDNSRTYLQAARLPLPPAFSVSSAVATYNDLSARCTMQYDAKVGGVWVQIDILFGVKSIPQA